jgi:Fic family protein
MIDDMKTTPLLQRLRDEKESNLKGGIYHRVQIDFTFNSNHIEGSRLSKEQTRFIFETNTLGITTDVTRIDDIMETVNHFRCIDYVIDNADHPITESDIKQLHNILKTNTSDSRKSWFAVGEYKRLPNEVGGIETTQPEDVENQIQQLLTSHDKIKNITLDDIIDFHVRFERIHPFQDGNGRIGRLLMFWQCLHSDIVPFIITEELRHFYYRGLQNWGQINGYLSDTCLAAQDDFKAVMKYFRV